MKCDSSPDDGSQPQRRLTLFDTTCIIVGIIIGATVFRSLPFIAYNVSRPSVDAYSIWVSLTENRRGLGVGEARAAVFDGTAGWEYDMVCGAGLQFAWALGGLLALMGALCYAELACAYPQEGGTYVYLTRAYGRRMGLAFAWAEFWIIRPGNIGAMAFVAAAYLQELSPLPSLFGLSPELFWAIAAVTVITIANLGGFTLEKRLQNTLTIAKVAGLITLIVVAYFWTRPFDYRAPASPFPAGMSQSFATAMVIIMFAYGGWSDMVYVAAEVRDPQKNLFRALVLGTLAVSAIYLFINQAFVEALTYAGLRNSQAVAADLMGLHFGTAGRTAISALIVVSCCGAIHGMMFTGSRAFFAAGAQHSMLGWMGVWNAERGVPTRALVGQSIATLALILIFGGSAGGFERLVNFTGPLFWGFLVLAALSLFVLRRREPQTARPYRVPFYPFLPLLFATACVGMSYAAADYSLRNLSAYGAAWFVLVLVSGAFAVVTDQRPSTPADA